MSKSVLLAFAITAWTADASELRYALGDGTFVNLESISSYEAVLSADTTESVLRNEAFTLPRSKEQFGLRVYDPPNWFVDHILSSFQLIGVTDQEILAPTYRVGNEVAIFVGQFTVEVSPNFSLDPSEVQRKLTPKFMNLSNSVEIESVNRHECLERIGGFSIQLRGELTHDVVKLIEKLNQESWVAAAYPDFVWKLQSKEITHTTRNIDSRSIENLTEEEMMSLHEKSQPIVNDPLFLSQDHLHSAQGTTSLKWEDAWSKFEAKILSHPTIAILDDGVSHRDHFDFVNEVEISGKPTGRNLSHGTKVALLAAAIANDHKGPVGIAPMAKIFSIKVGARNEYLQGDVCRGVMTALDSGSKILNFSLYTAKDPSITSAIRYAIVEKGALVVAATGNVGQCPTINQGSEQNPQLRYDCSTKQIRFPALLSSSPDKKIADGVVAVGAITHSGKLKTIIDHRHPPGEDGIGGWGSRFGEAVSITARGDNLVIGYLNEQQQLSGVKRFHGTSAATPLVSGAAAFLLATAQKSISPKNMKMILMKSAQDLTLPEGEPVICASNGIAKSRYFGAGALDLYSALEMLHKNEPVLGDIQCSTTPISSTL